MTQPEKSPKPKKTAAAPVPAPVPEVAPAPAAAPPRRRSLFGSGFFVSILFLGAVGGLATYLHQIVPDLQERPEYQFRMDETRITSPNDWVPRGILQEVLAASKLPETVSLLQPDLCRDVWMAWSQHPWVYRVKQVRIDPARYLVVDLEYRVPVAFIEVPQRGFYPVDIDGVLLPPKDFSVSETSMLPHVTRIASLPNAGTGQVWQDPAVIGAAKLSAVLAPGGDLNLYWTRFKFKNIIAPPVTDKNAGLDTLTFEIETTAGNRIVWGKAPGGDALEPTPEVKLARLAEYQTRFGTLDGVSGLHRIDIRPVDGYSLQPLNEDRYR